MQEEIDQKLSTLDLTLFDGIASQTTDADKRSMLAIQNAVRNRCRTYTYLEIGSYHGGSIQPHLLDPACRKIYSIDKRPVEQYDERGASFSYPEGSTQIMLEKLRAVCPEQMEKIQTFDLDAADFPVEAVGEQPELFFIDGEHTDGAVVSDFNAVYKLISGPAVVAFHDAQIVFKGLLDITARLEADGAMFHAYCLPNCIFVIELNGFDLHKDPWVHRLLIDSYQAYLPSLDSLRKYREYCNDHRLVRGYIAAYKSAYRLYSRTLRPLKKSLLGK